MIYIKLDDHTFEYEILDIVKLFFKEDEIVTTDQEFPVDSRDIFLAGGIQDCEGRQGYRLQFKGGGLGFSASIGLLTRSAEDAKETALQMDEREACKLLKRGVKQQVYDVLSKHFRRKLPWGIMTGVRPTKVVHEMLEKGWDREKILRQLNDSYRVSRKKAELLYDVAETEGKILRKTTPDRVGIYIGIPFCITRCLYCSFTSNPIDKCIHLVGDYLNALKAEIAGVQKMIEDRRLRIQSIYIGGGTPTSLDEGALKQLLSFIENTFDLSGLEEFTLEAGRPDSIDSGKLEAIKQSKVSRISINPQTMNDETLRLIGRNHTAADIAEAFRLARKTGFDNINMDVIIGLPGEDLGMFENTLRQIGEMGPESLTVHTMAVKRASRLKEEQDRFRLTPDELASAMAELAQDYAGMMGLHPYYLYRQKKMLGNLENIGYCKPGFESVYNIQIMEEKQTIIALGAGGITKVVYPAENRLERAFNVKNVEEYIVRLDEMLERKKALL